jgi:DNA-binding transcriptional regulator GbsR (MarR family)
MNKNISKWFRRQFIMNKSNPVDSNLPDISTLMVWVDELDPKIKIKEEDEEMLRDLFEKTNGLI